jgi:two-component system response regulator YesN
LIFFYNEIMSVSYLREKRFIRPNLLAPGNTGGGSMKILVVDDEAKHRRGMFHLIRSIRPQYEVLAAKNGLEAMEEVRASQPDVVLTDIRMPKMDGLAFLEKLGETGTRPKVVLFARHEKRA